MVGIYLFLVSWFFQPQWSLALSHDAPEATTALLGKHAVWVRRVLFSTVICVIGFLLVGSALVIHVKRQGKFEITLGELTIKRTGIYWQGTLWCPNRMEKPNAEPTLQSPLANAHDRGGLELGTLANAHERRGRELERMELEASQGEDSARAPPFSASEKLEMMRKFEAEQVAKHNALEELEMMRKFEAEQVAKHKSAISQRRWLLTSLFFIYCGVSMGLPLAMAGTVSCSNGYFWETHTYFVGVFGLTKIYELHLYATDESVAGGLDLVTFMFKFTTSFLGYVDAYTDATAIVIAHSCPDPLAQALSKCMLVSYIVGVLVAQWVVVASFAFQDPSHACIMKVLHMDALASCVSLPDDMKDTWNSLHMARTFGEDIPQAVLQSIYILKVKRNYFMMASICVGLGSSCKALIDAYSRRLEAAGLYERLEQAEEQAAESLIETLQENRDLHDEIGDAECGDLIHLLRDKGGPKPITLRGRTLGKDAVTFLVSVVKMRRKIETLDLSHCNISDEGARSLSDAVKEDDTLQKIICTTEPPKELTPRSREALAQAIETVRKNGLDLEYINEPVRSDKGVVIEAVKQNGKALQYCSPELQADKAVAIEAVKQYGDALQYCSKELRGDQEFVMEAAHNSPTALKFALNGLNQDPLCLLASGLTREWSAYAEKRSEKGIFSVKFGLTELASNLSTVVAVVLAKHPEMRKFDIYNANLYCKKSCDPNFTDLTWPCRGTETTCTREQNRKTTTADGRPTNLSCWRLSFRLHEKACKDTGGFMLQLEEYGRLGAGQEIETLMAEELDLKIFRIRWHRDPEFGFPYTEDMLNRMDAKSRLANQIADAVLDWFADEKRDTKIEVIEACIRYESKRFDVNWLASR